MGNEWKLEKFNELLLEPLRNGIYKKKEFHGSGAKIVNMGELFRYPRLYDVAMKRVQLNESETKKALLNEGDLLFARRSLTAEGAGKCIIVKEISEDTTFESSIIRARPDPDKAYSDYLYYFFNSPKGKYLLGTITRQVAVAGITGGDLKELEIPVPNLQSQRFIVKVLSSLDEKIRNNRQINQTLESMAQALFKSWFVDFDPVIDNALAEGNEIPEPLAAKAAARRALQEQSSDKACQPHTLPDHIRQLFPSRFQFTEELGWIPEGWKVIGFNKLAKLDTTSVKPNLSPNDIWEHYSIPAFDVDQMPALDAGSDIKSNKYRVSKNAILCSKLNPHVPRVWWPEPLEGEASICSTEFMQFVPFNGKIRAFLYGLITAKPFQDGIAERVTGSTGSRQRAQPQQVAVMNVLAPTENLMLTYSEIANELISKQQMSRRANQTLSRMRDTLLPKLLSGELRVPEAERELDNVLS